MMSLLGNYRVNAIFEEKFGRIESDYKRPTHDSIR